MINVDTKVDTVKREVTFTVQESALSLPVKMTLPFWMIKRTAALVLTEEVKHETGGSVG